MASELGVPVCINVYDLHEYNRYVHFIGFGAYHTAVEFKGREWAFGYDDFGSGVYCCRPGTHPNATLREKIQLGKVPLSADDVLRHINRLSSEFQGRSYHLLYRNCNHFTISLARALTGRKGRYYFNRLSRLARLVVCCLPSEMHPRPGVDDARQTCLEKILVKFYGRRPTQDIQMEIIQHQPGEMSSDEDDGGPAHSERTVAPLLRGLDSKKSHTVCSLHADSCCSGEFHRDDKKCDFDMDAEIGSIP